MESKDERRGSEDDGRCAEQLFGAQAREAPNSLAILYREQRLTYAELDAKANQLAHYLIERGVGPDVLVGICMERGIESIVAILGILKAGGAYVPLDPDYPAERLTFVLTDARVNVVLTQDRLLERVRALSVAGHIVTCVVSLDDEASVIANGPVSVPDDTATNANLAYVIYTSGSTGQPKGVLIERRGLCNIAEVQLQTFGLGIGDHVLHFSSLSFDASVFEIFMAFRAGATLVIVPPEERVPGPILSALLRAQKISIVTLPPSVLAALPLEAFPDLKVVTVAGEACSAELVERWAPGRRFFNLYGPTETTIWATVAQCIAGQGTPPIGQAIANTQAYVLDANLRLVSAGEVGELHIGGIGLARGYLNLPQLTAEKFIEDPFAATPGARLYKTGDLVRMQPDGNLDFVGRRDDQVKMRGFRVELGEIEAVVRSIPGVSDAVVVARPGASGDAHLIAYFVRDEHCSPARGGAEKPAGLTVTVLRRHLALKLPHYMVPAFFVSMKALPLTIQGKVDRRALPDPELERDQLSAAYRAPQTLLEATLVALWERVLKVEHIGLDDSFFELGGDSLRGAVLINALQESLGVQLYIVALFDAPTVAKQVDYLEKHFPDTIAAKFGGRARHGTSNAARINAAAIENFRLQAARWHQTQAGCRPPPGERNKRMAFILSPPRSGSSLLRILLGGNRRIFAPPELELLSFNTLGQRRDRLSGRLGFMREGVIRAFMEIGQHDAEQADRAMAEYEAQDVSTQAFYGLLQESIGGRLLVDKSTTYALSPDTLERAEDGFEDAVYIHLVRHPYGMMRSFEEARLDRVLTLHGEQEYPVRQFAELTWLLSHQNILGFLSRVPAHRHVCIHFEDLVRTPQPVLESVCALLGVQFDPVMLNPYQDQSGRMTDGAYAHSVGMTDPKFHAHRKIDPAVADRWQEVYREDFLSGYTWQLAQELGYAKENPQSFRPSAGDSDRVVLKRAPFDSEHPPIQSYAQQRLWFIDRLAPGNPSYNTSRVIELGGTLNVAALEGALSEIVRRHEICRTTYESYGGEPVQLIHPARPFLLERCDLVDLEPARRQEELQRVAASEIMFNFDLSRGPLCRGTLVRVNAQRHVLVLVIHHILTDAWARGVLHKELSVLYRAYIDGQASPLPDLPIQYADYAVWQRQMVEGAEGRELEAYWLDNLAGAPPRLVLPTDRSRPTVQTHQGASKTVRLSDELRERLTELGREENATLFMVLLCGLGILLARYNEQNDLVLGIPVSGRNRPEFEPMMGLFLNILPIRAHLPGEASLRSVLRDIRESCIAAYAHQDYPFDLLVSKLKLDRSLNHHPVFQVMFGTHQPLLENLELHGLHCTHLNIGPRPMPYDLVVTALDEPGGLEILIDYNVDLFDAASIDRMARQYVRLLESMNEFPNRPISALSLLAEGDRERLLYEWNGTQKAYERDAGVHALFEAQAALAPAALALEYDDERLTYAQLNAQANQLAHYLRELGVNREVLVGLAFERSAAAVVAMLAILKAGGAYVPLDPDYPAERLNLMLDDSQAPIIVSHSKWLSALPETNARVVCIDRDRAKIEACKETNLGDAAHAEDLAYVIYTSGSTGTPKGVQVPHRGITRLVRNSDYVEIRPTDRFAQVSVVSFDAATFEIWGALLNGAAVVGVPRAISLSPREFAAFLPNQSITTLFLTTALFNQMAREVPAGFQSLRYVLFGGEAVDPQAVRAVLQGGAPVNLLHVYGPTEVTTFSTWHRVDKVEPGATTVPIGRPIANTRAYVLDEERRPVPVGIAGELYLGGDGVARGYLKRAELTAQYFVDDPFLVGERLYRTGDWVRYREDGAIEFVGRRDSQVKVRGFRIELGEIESALKRLAQVREAVVVVREDEPGERRVVAYVVPDAGQAEVLGELRGLLKRQLPDYMVPAAIVVLDALPLTPNGKVDRGALPVPQTKVKDEQRLVLPRGELEKRIAQVWQDLLQLDRIGVRDNFFDLGGHSLLLVKLQGKLCAVLPDQDISIVDLFEYPTIEALARHLGAPVAEPSAPAANNRAESRKHQVSRAQPIAIVGMAGRYPGCESPEILWRAICAGTEFVTVFSDAELHAAGVSEAVYRQPNYIKSGVVLDDVGWFDATFFGYTPREAQVLDPQQRLFLECAWEALENAGCDPFRYSGAIGAFAGISQNRYLNLLVRDRTLAESFSDVENLISSDKDFLATRVSYKFNLRGPGITVQTACSTSLVAVHMAVRSLREFECDMALAGGVSIKLPQKTGYLYSPQGIASPDGHCRAFDAEAQGTMRGNGASIVVLKRLEDALADGDRIIAVVKGSAINNDGTRKVGFTAPSVDGQAEVIAAAQFEAEVHPGAIGYIEAHGTGTRLGDPVEVAALTKAFRAGTDRVGYCGIGSIKTNIGHLDAAAGCTGLIKAALALEHEEIPASLHFKTPNPEIDFANSPFYVVDRLTPWPAGGKPRFAGVSSFGIGGTNAHVVLEEAPPREPSGASREHQVFVLSARSDAALSTAQEQLIAHMGVRPDQSFADIAYTLQVGRREFDWRVAIVCRERAQAQEILAAPPPVHRGRATGKHKGVVFMFTGQGSQYPNMGEGLYRSEAVYREAMDACFEILRRRVELDLKAVLYFSGDDAQAAAERLRETQHTQPALFATEYALARLWMSWGIVPEAMIGHSIGEYVAACLAGVMSLEDALVLVALRGRLIAGLDRGVMLAIPLGEQEVLSLLGEELSLAAVNAPQLCVVSGSTPALERLEVKLRDRGLEAVRLHTSHAFHSNMVEPILEEFASYVGRVNLAPPELAFVSNLSGTWARADEVTSAEYWVRHMRETVRFSAGIALLLNDAERVFLEVGPGSTLANLVRQQASGGFVQQVVSSLHAPHEKAQDEPYLLDALAKLWVTGVEVNWQAFRGNERRHRVPLPTYPFERQKYWVDTEECDLSEGTRYAGDKNPDIADWFYVPAWSRSVIATAPADRLLRGPYLVFADELGIAKGLIDQLIREGECVIEVCVSTCYAVLEAGRSYTLNPGAHEDYVKLFAELLQYSRLPRRVLHCWGINGGGAEDPSEIESREVRGFYSALFLAQLMGENGREADIDIVTKGVHDVVGSERLYPENAMVLGVCRVVPQEYPFLSCRNVDFAIGETTELIAANLLAEVYGSSRETVVAYRGSQRWIQRFEPIPLGADLREPPKLRPSGVYLITGGMGGMGLALARYLAKSVQAKLVLVNRSPFPGRESWAELLSSDATNDATARKIRALRELESLGAEVFVWAADVTDKSAMQQVLSRIEREIGPVRGVIHAAGVGGGGIVQFKTRANVAAVIGPKVEGTRVLARLFAGKELDFMVLCSSLASIVGGASRVDYCAGNAFLDAFAASRQSSDWPIVAINWDTWGEVGMAVEAELPGELAARRDQVLRTGMTVAEGVEAFRRILAAVPTLSQTIVSTRDFGTRIGLRRASNSPDARISTQAAAADVVRGHARSDQISSAYIAPRDDSEATLAKIWQDLLGIDRVGIDDNFFELGGHSLLAIRVLDRTNEALGLKLSFQQLFDAPTIALLAAKIGEVRAERQPDYEKLAMLLENLDDHPEEEIERMLAEVRISGRVD